MTEADARRLALSMPEAEEKSHFGKADFRVRNRIFMSLAALNCGGSNISSPAQGVVFPVNGKEKQNFQCEQKEGSTTRKCSNGESYKFDALSGSGSYLEETTRTVESKFNGGTLTLTTQSRVEGLVKVVFDSQVTQKVVLKLSGNGCSISAFDTAITTKGMPGSKTKMLKQVSCTVQ